MPDLSAAQFGFPSGACAIFRRLSTPDRIQRFLDEEIRYDRGDNCRTPLRMLAERRGHCVEGAMFAACALRIQGHRPLLLDMEAERDDDHVVAIFQRGGLWGAIGKSNYSGLRYREPVYRNLRELVMSYFEHYFNSRGQRTLRSYSRPINLSQFDARGWMTGEEDPWYIPEYLTTVSHTPILPRKAASRLTKQDARLRAANEFGMRVAG